MKLKTGETKLDYLKMTTDVLDVFMQNDTKFIDYLKA
jgi:hypothetical protein